MRLSTFNTTLISSTVELQEAQCFFTISIQIATLTTGTSLFAFSSLSEIITNGELVRALAINSILPILVLQSILHRTRVRWWYTLYLTLATCLLAHLIQQKTMSPSFEALWNNIRDIEPVAECGGHPSLTTYCLALLPERGFKSVPALQVAYGMIFCLVVDRINRSVDLKKRLPAKGLVRGSATHILYHIPILVFYGIRVFIQFGLFVAVGLHLHLLWSIHGGLNVSLDQWTYGQVVAAMIWAPVLAKYTYCNIFGVKDTVERRLDEHDTYIKSEEVKRLENSGGYIQEFNWRKFLDVQTFW
ncbi:hypothetical protein QBC35DRAFT_454243 [Podospora australis]|uniref:Uncharacterized protein n=1 Tax=Podospora australis TaxID=1536484 RepID=A0AAN6WNT6_9PEZI|nr:hypothetical protein QBC35DRAFT_454243 [Podospora australis]